MKCERCGEVRVLQNYEAIVVNDDINFHRIWLCDKCSDKVPTISKDDMKKRKETEKYGIRFGEENLEQASTDVELFLKTNCRVIRCLSCNEKFSIFQHSTEHLQDFSLELLKPLKYTVYCPFCGK